MEECAATFAATPPYEACKLQLSLMMTGPRSQAGFVTIDGKVYKLLKAMYGLREMREQRLIGKVLDVMNSMRVSLGKFSICVG